MSENALRKSMNACNICNVEVQERRGKGEKVIAICRDLEDFQRQITGEVFYKAEALKKRYQRELERSGQNVPKKTAEEMLESVKDLAEDAEVLAKMQTFIPMEKPEPVVEPVPVVKTASDFAEDVRKLILQANGIVTQRGHGFSDSERETLKEQLGLLFRNLGG
jgi:hypothetical protein